MLSACAENDAKNDIVPFRYGIMKFEDISRRTPEGLEVHVMVSPRSSRSGVEGIDPWRKRLVVKVKAPPLDGKANKEVEDVMKGITECRSEIIFGHTDRLKTVLIEGDPDTIIEKMEARL